MADAVAEKRETLKGWLQTAIELELATIPPYMIALLSIKLPTNREAADLITARWVSTVESWAPSVRQLALFESLQEVADGGQFILALAQGPHHPPDECADQHRHQHQPELRCVWRSLQ